MIFLLIALIITVPYILGTGLTMILGDRSTRGPVRWTMGALAAFVCFFVCLLISIKAKSDLGFLSRLFIIVVSSFTIGAFPIMIYGFVKKEIRIQNIDERIIVWLIPAFLLGLFSIIVISPSYINDITKETVKTTLYSGTIYENSSLLGIKMEAGLPIFNKIEIVPMLYACLSNIFGVEPEMIMNLLMPVCTYVANLAIMWEISRFLVSGKNRNIFMIFHLLLLIAGTYLPKNAIPVTSGFPLLMQGYTGYAWGIGVLIPAIVLLLLQKRYIFAGFMIISFPGLFKLDRIFFAAKEFLSGYHGINLAGKLFILYIASLIWFILRRKKHYIPIWAFFSGAALISAALTDAYEYVGEKKSFIVSAGLVILACCSFYPFKGAEFVLNKTDYNYGSIRGSRKTATIWAPEDIIEKARRSDAGIFPIYGRDAFNPMLAGSNYEQLSEDAKDLLYAMDIIETYMDSYVETLICPELETNKELEKVDAVVLPKDTASERINMVLVKRGFIYRVEYDKYLILRRYD